MLQEECAKLQKELDKVRELHTINDREAAKKQVSFIKSRIV